MSWHYSQELVGEYLAACSPDGDVFAPLKETDMPATYCWRDKTTECLSLFQFGMMSQPSTVDHGAALLTWYREAFLVRTSALREQCGDATAWRENDPVYGGRTCGLLTRFVRPMFSVRIARRYAPADWTKLSKDLPRSGMHHAGSSWELTASDCITNASGYGSTLPTPTARDWKDTFGMGTERADGKTRLDRLPMLLFSRARSADSSSKTPKEPTDAKTVELKDLVQVEITGRDYCPELPEWAMGWPIGWTALSPLETDRFQQWLLSHGKFYT
jgi:hypothetical protein